MSAPKVEISTDNKTWSNTVKFITNQKVSIFYRITSGDASLIKISVPVTGIDGVTDAKGIMSELEWNTALLKIIEGPDDPDDFEVEKDRTTGKTAINATVYTKRDCIIIFSITFNAADKALTTDCGYEYKDKQGKLSPRPVPGQFDILITNEPVPPQITSFNTTSAALLTTEEYILSWEVADAEELYIEVDGKPLGKAEENRTGKPDPGVKTVTLVATSGTTADGTPVYTTKKSITIVGRSETGISPVPDPFEGGLLVNLIKKDELAMYGLVTDKYKSNVWLWETNDGVKWRKTSTAFNDKIPAAAAGSSSIYYNGAIYLIGGSRFDPNEKSANVYYLDFSTGEWRQHSETGFEERMGQAVVIVKDTATDAGDIYMLGGYGHEGPLKDVYTFNIAKGWKHEFNMKTSLCLHTAVFRDRQLQVFGGSTEGPSHPDQRMKDALGSNILSNDKEWKSLKFADSTSAEALKYYIVTCAMAMCKGNTFFFGLYEMDTSFTDLTSQIEDVKLTDVHSKNYIEPEYCSSLQAIEFKNAVWLCNVHDNDTLTSGGLKYFLFQPTKPSLK